jgi:hypothetical protein
MKVMDDKIMKIWEFNGEMELFSALRPGGGGALERNAASRRDWLVWMEEGV